MPNIRLCGVEVDVRCSTQAPDDLETILEQAFRANRWLWGRLPSQVVVQLCVNEDEFKTHAGGYYGEKVAACVNREGALICRTREGGLKNPSRFPAIVRHETNHACWIKFLGEGFRRVDEGPESVWNAYWLCEAIANWVGNDDFLLSREALQGRAEYGEVSAADFAYPYSDSLYFENGEFSEKKIHRLYSLWASFFVWVTAGRPAAFQALIRAWTKKETTQASLDGAFEQVFCAPLIVRINEFLSPTWS